MLNSLCRGRPPLPAPQDGNGRLGGRANHLLNRIRTGEKLPWQLDDRANCYQNTPVRPRLWLTEPLHWKEAATWGQMMKIKAVMAVATLALSLLIGATGGSIEAGAYTPPTIPCSDCW